MRTARFPVVAAAAVLASFAPLAAQEEERLETVKDIEPELEAVEDTRKSRGDAETGGMTAIASLVQRYAKMDKRAQAAVLKEMRRCLFARRKPEQAALLDAASEALSEFGRKGGEVLAMAIDHQRYKNEKPWRAFRARLVRRLGKIADKKFTKTLIDLARKDNDDGVSAAAGAALANYAKHDQKVRKLIVKELLKALEAVNTVASTLTTGSLGGSGGGGGNPALAASQRLREIRGPWMQTLRKLTGQRFNKVIDWRKWHEKNKRRKWS